MNINTRLWIIQLIEKYRTTDTNSMPFAVVNIFFLLLMMHTRNFNLYRCPLQIYQI
jgi:hypothetical protein